MKSHSSLLLLYYMWQQKPQMQISQDLGKKNKKKHNGLYDSMTTKICIFVI